MHNDYILRVVCPDSKGIIAAVTSAISAASCNIIHLSQYSAIDISAFFLKCDFEAPRDFAHAQFKADFAAIAKRYLLEWSVGRRNRAQRVGILVSKTSHCLYELLLKHQDGELDCEIAVIISNHPDLEKIAQQFGIPWAQVDTSAGKAATEAQLEAILQNHGVELVILARYMQILSGEMCARWRGRMINIHHGFLPAFQGARPYHQAWAKGVKIIGATAHFVSEDLDQGPIIAQDVVRVSDTMSVDDMIRLGKDVERTVLFEAVKLWLQGSVFIREGRTFILD